jgi:hypothetical protein
MGDQEEEEEGALVTFITGGGKQKIMCSKTSQAVPTRPSTKGSLEAR